MHYSINILFLILSKRRNEEDHDRENKTLRMEVGKTNTGIPEGH